ncbi:MAG: hypothetical protein J6P45_04975 [Lachnospiraceae bacterium]|nr:hypothetical protein [Lachnospiraceae bacterium]MBR1877104.1 hypothetical protein [Lachnospiraceae bacterium]
MFTLIKRSEENADWAYADKLFERYFFISLFLMLFGAVYEWFSHGVYSYYMLYAFGFPLIGGALPCLLCIMNGRKLLPGMSNCLWGAGIAALTAGSLFKGVLDIYGTSSDLGILYPIVGIVCCTGAVILKQIKRRGYRI